ncbi:glutamyl-tRNA reductase [Listeria ivanovii]|uniref:Glutamyl-tRNA reductase n=1 Tax=Listeria ivanovii TaxID=1638 RepID=A0AAX2DQ05_LISIV|nr:glutamyl-tRNA reductase [Listeria ivanovii]EFR96808.1 glutamyl-tRNA reductase [Listeria ivanovii FSL F6-596]AIS62788.1 glutamyl-tRNA reductase [Listeria ivanovii subsp. londoniensis]MBK1966920.1 glutamyl-tRNA reductase [Listeria ivanovii subsp. londoniensis]MBK1985035.1 glutamyl-tRNA reductase [Listeria ivanovii subsp. londoniensis]MBK1996298.1 glutamyl-tRNA reductase [Listeria ivanovii subsp. londoniensis]
MFILTMGLNHHTAPIDIREKLVFKETEEEMALVTLLQEKSILENVIISTCNRTEIVAVVDQLHTGRYYLKRFMANWFQMEMEKIEPYLFFREESLAVNHLYKVTAGLDSLVLGETQILGQVKHAYEIAKQTGTTGTLLNKLFREVVTFAKKVHHYTKINENAVSVSYAAVEVAKKLYGTLENKRIVLVGAGEMSELALQNLAGSGIHDITVINRTKIKGEALASRFQAKVGTYEEMNVHLLLADIVLVSTSASEPIIKHADMHLLMEQKASSLLVIDIGLPRNVEHDCSYIPNFHLYDIDDLAGVVTANSMERKRIVSDLEETIETEVQTFFEWEKQLGVVPVIRELRKKALDMQEVTMTSLENKLPGLTEREYIQIGKHMKSIINQMLKQPISELKEMSVERDADLSIKHFKRIFGLEGVLALEKEQAETRSNT